MPHWGATTGFGERQDERSLDRSGLGQSPGRLPGYSRGRRWGRQGGPEGSRWRSSLRCWFKDEAGESDPPPPRRQESCSRASGVDGAGAEARSCSLSSLQPLPASLIPASPRLPPIAIPPSWPSVPRSLGTAEAGVGAQGTGTGGLGEAGHLVPPPVRRRLRKPGQTPEPPRPRPAAHLISSWHLPPLPPWKSHQCGPPEPPAGPAPPPHWPAQ